mmetsp:Transcript_14338/g.22109  ORF Transcript_14338/g.22109 Transcript_14338/m.22109 type:complete len:118 (-) Transcript_14338:1521-1874(-)
MHERDDIGNNSDGKEHKEESSLFIIIDDKMEDSRCSCKRIQGKTLCPIIHVEFLAAEEVDLGHASPNKDEEKHNADKVVLHECSFTLLDTNSHIICRCSRADEIISHANDTGGSNPS